MSLAQRIEQQNIDVSTSPAPRPSPTPAADRLGRWLPALTVLAVVITALVTTDTSPWDIARYGAYVAWTLVLPGTLVYRALRGRPRALVEDLVMGLVVGLSLEIGAWAAFSGLDLRGLLWIWPATVVLPFALAPGLRQHWRPKGYVPPPLSWSWCVAAIITLVIGYVWLVFLNGPAPVPASGTHTYFIDLPYMLSLIAEAKHHFPMSLPQVASQPLYYHWFVYAHEATASLISGVDTPVVFFRLSIVLFCVGAVAVLAVAGWRVTGSPWGGVVAAALMFVVGELSLGPIGSTFSNVFIGGIWGSHSQAYSYLFIAPVAALVADRLRRRRDAGTATGEWGWGPQAWILLTLLCFGAAGARSTILPIVLGGLGVVVVIAVSGRFRRTARGWWWPILAVTLPVLAAEIFAMVVLFAGEPSGLRLRFKDTIGPYLEAPHNRELWKDLVLIVLAVAAWTVYMLARVAGVPVLAWLARRGRRSEGAVRLAWWGAPEWFLLGALATGAVATMLLGHPAWGQVNFIRTSFMFGAILSAQGYVALVQRSQASPRLVAAFVAIGAVVAVAVVSIVVPLGGAIGGPGFRALRPIATNAAGLMLALAVGTGAWLALRRRWTGLRGKGPVLALTVVLAAGLPAIGWDAFQSVRNGSMAYLPSGNSLTPDRLAAARWLRDNSHPDDVVAVNHPCRDPRDQCNSGTDFWLEAYSERRQLVGNWLYAPRTITANIDTETGIGGSPFWDQQLLADNNAAFYAPTVAGIEALHRDHGVRWFVVDRHHGVESPLLRQLLTVRYERDSIAIYEVIGVD